MAEYIIYLFLGFGGAWGLIFLAKGLMARLLQRKADYYEAGKEERHAV